MLNYGTLNDYDFEILCKDIMEVKLQTPLRNFGRGKDGGIDLCDADSNRKLIVQVKHYLQSNFSVLYSALKQEKQKLAQLHPTDYFLCLSLSLTPANIRKIYALFDEYMSSPQNIITIEEIDIFLRMDQHQDILRKNYKLWLDDTNVLNHLLMREQFIDCEVLLADLEEEKNYFVPTQAYDDSLTYLQKKRILLVTGGPGVGKTTLCKMLLFKLAADGYKIIYSTSNEQSSVKKMFSYNPSAKEVVFLDDVIGQHYLSLHEQKETELIHLIRYIQMHPNKMLIMNSRIAIFNELRQRSETFAQLLHREIIQKYTLSMNTLSLYDKARIFYNHLAAQQLPKSYFNQLQQENQYMAIIKHPNYTPRIIAHITDQKNIALIKPHNYFSYIQQCLNFPESIWKNEFEERLTEVDRLFLYILYSFSDTVVEAEKLKHCFQKNIAKRAQIDTTINHFEKTVQRLNESMIVSYIHQDQKLISVINPSVNDFLKNIFYENTTELNNLQAAITDYQQIPRCYPNASEQEIYLTHLVEQQKIKQLAFDDLSIKASIIVFICSKEQIHQACYQVYFMDYFTHHFAQSSDQAYELEEILTVMTKNTYQYYQLDQFFKNQAMLEQFLAELTIDRFFIIVTLLNHHLGWTNEQLLTLIQQKIQQLFRTFIETNFWETLDLDRSIKITHAKHFENRSIDLPASLKALKKNMNKTFNRFYLQLKLPQEMRVQLTNEVATLLNKPTISKQIEDYIGYIYGEKEAFINEELSETLEHFSDKDIDWIFQR